MFQTNLIGRIVRVKGMVGFEDNERYYVHLIYQSSTGFHAIIQEVTQTGSNFKPERPLEVPVLNLIAL